MNESYAARLYRKFKEDSGGKWWLYMYFIISLEENRRAATSAKKIPVKDTYYAIKEVNDGIL